MDIQQYIADLGQRARAASRHLARADSGAKNRPLAAIAAALRSHRSAILDANARDMRGAAATALEASLLARLDRPPARSGSMGAGREQVIAVADPRGASADLGYRPSGIQVGRMRGPLGVSGIIYESRPNVSNDAS